MPKAEETRKPRPKPKLHQNNRNGWVLSLGMPPLPLTYQSNFANFVHTYIMKTCSNRFKRLLMCSYINSGTRCYLSCSLIKSQWSHSVTIHSRNAAPAICRYELWANVLYCFAEVSLWHWVLLGCRQEISLWQLWLHFWTLWRRTYCFKHWSLCGYNCWTKYCSLT